MNVDYIDHMGSDLSVVNAARVSFSKTSTTLSDEDKKLIKYLASHKHWTPFAHTAISVRVKAPVFVARQLGKHQVGLVWNEVSRRYIDSWPDFYVPKEWRKRANNVKQGSSNETVSTISTDALSMWHEDALVYYNLLLKDGVAPEMARMVLPQSMYTVWIWTGNLVSFSNMYKLRTDSHSQKETQEVARMIGEVVEPLFPVSWKALLS